MGARQELPVGSADESDAGMVGLTLVVFGIAVQRSCPTGLIREDSEICRACRLYLATKALECRARSSCCHAALHAGDVASI
jgi:hypothetical protein